MSSTIEVAGDTEVRPFRIEVPEQDLVELRRRIAATRWPTGELVTDRSQACSWRRSASSPATGPTSTTGGGARPS